MKENNVSMATIKKVSLKAKAKMENGREVSKCGKETMQHLCNKWIELFITHVHAEQKHKPIRKIYADDVNAAFATFILRGVKDDSRK